MPPRVALSVLCCVTCCCGLTAAGCLTHLPTPRRPRRPNGQTTQTYCLRPFCLAGAWPEARRILLELPGGLGEAGSLLQVGTGSEQDKIPALARNLGLEIHISKPTQVWAVAVLTGAGGSACARGIGATHHRRRAA